MENLILKQVQDTALKHQKRQLVVTQLRRQKTQRDIQLKQRNLCLT